MRIVALVLTPSTSAAMTAFRLDVLNRFIFNNYACYPPDVKNQNMTL